MPRLFTNRPRIDRRRDDDDLDIGFIWETKASLLYELGGVLFIIGSVLFMPRFEAWKDVGAWLFFVGSLVYLAVLVDDILEVRQFWPRHRDVSLSRMLELSALTSYILGTLLFVAGSLFFLSWWGWFIAGAWMFVIGSALFVFGAAINELMIIRASSAVTLQLMNLTALTFVTGSLLFLVASVPYLWHFEAASDKHQIDSFLAWQYLIGSILFLVGGILNHERSRLVRTHRRRAVAQDPEADKRLMSFMRGEISEQDFYGNGPQPGL